MKSQARLGLRRPGRHHLTLAKVLGDAPGWIRTHDVGQHLLMAFQMNCHPKHYDTGIEEPTYTMDYITGETTWHGPPPYIPEAFINLTMAES